MIDHPNLSRSGSSAPRACRDCGLGVLPPRRGVLLLRIALAVVLGISWCTGAVAKADPQNENLLVPSAAMGRHIPLAFLAGGPHAVHLLDACDAAPDVSNWVTAGHAMQTLAGKGISVTAPASVYTNWEQDGSRQWETFLSQEPPDWLAANRGLPAPGGHGIVGAAQGGTGALIMAEFHPDRFRYQCWSTTTQARLKHPRLACERANAPLV